MLQNHFDNLDQRTKILARKSQQEPQIKLQRNYVGCCNTLLKKTLTTSKNPKKWKKSNIGIVCVKYYDRSH
jgi:hypothetical protein